MGDLEKVQGLEDLNRLLENASVSVHLVGKDGIILWANDAELGFLGYTYDEYVNHSITEFHADQKVISDILLRLSDGGTLIDYPARLVCKNGKIRDVLINSNVFWVDGEFVHTRCFTRDITELKRAEAELLESNLRLEKSLLELQTTTVSRDTLAEEVTQRQRAEEQLRRWANETSVMVEIGRVINLSLDINDVYHHLGEEIKRLIPFDRMSLTLVNYENGTMSPRWVLGTDVPGRRERDEVPLVGAFAAEVVRAKSSILLELEAETEAELEHRFPLLLDGFRAGLRSFLVVPLFSRNAVIGVLGVMSKYRGVYTRPHLELLERMASQIADAVANSRLHADLKRTEEALRDSEEQTRASLGEKEVLLKEINHRVKNNLQIISSLLNLQSRDIQDEQALRSFQVSQDRIRAMALVHEKLYQSEDLARIDFGEYIRSLATDLGNSYGLSSRHIDLKIDVDNILLGVDTAIPCGVIVNELVANSLKHAFPAGQSGEITVSFQLVDGQYTMIFKDDGVGLPEDLDISNPSSLGLTIVNALTGQLGGTIGLGRNGGSEISITFPAK